MQIGSLGIVGGAAGIPMSQAKGEADRAREASAAREQKSVADAKADDAAGIGRTDGENHETNERDADGRRLWEAPPEAKTDGENADDPANQSAPGAVDPTGTSGSQLDLSG